MKCPLGCADPGSTTMCAHCGSDLEPGSPAGDTRPGEQETVGGGASAGVLAVRFAFGDVLPCPDSPVRLGRDPLWSPYATSLSAHRNVSRRHATVGLDPDGGAWIDPEQTPNGTFRNGEELPPNRRHPLSRGDLVRLAAGPEGVVAVMNEEEER
ncbi:hypothetical protein GCM10009850_027510 [Nonomuraea monospora]|uniref:FHA domain-containing protein n=1 Tax=Nonomuraea monospora TaxID=568818 RepID=A0ABP5P9L4_9ACTN